MPGHTLFGKVSPHAVTMCYNSPYRQHLLDMIKEVAENYPVSGFFFDCLQPYPCVCPVCSAKMKEQGKPIQAVNIGVVTYDVHSFKERMSISSAEKTYKMLCAFLENIK